MLFWAGALLSAYIGYKLLGWWVPAAVACAVVVGQFLMFQPLLGDSGSLTQLLTFSLLMNLVMFYATFGIGRTVAQRLRQRRKGVR